MNANQDKATVFQSELMRIELQNVPVNLIGRDVPRKELAIAARKLFKTLGLKGVSVTVPNYSMAQAVDIYLPRRDDHILDGGGYVVEGDAARAANNAALQKFREIMDAAFPNCRDKSDSSIDHFDYRWMISS